jgi:putative transcriptional regulator
MLNKPSNTANRTVLQRINIDVPDLTGDTYAGGPVNNASVHFLHTAEVLSMETLVGPHGGICSSGDTGFLAEILQGNIPRRFRMFVGLCSWAPGQLEGELTGTPPWTKDHSWLIAPASEEIVFDYNGMEQWSAAVEYCAQHTVKDWML